MALRLHSFFIGVPVIMISDPELAAIVLKESNRKGYALEKYSSVPAWKPIISLESEDGPVWKKMSKNFHILLQRLPPVSRFSDIAAINIATLRKHCGETKTIDSNMIVKLTIETFLTYVLNCTWRPEFQIFIDASWEWRKEIAIKGRADIAVKEKTVKYFVSLLKETNPNHNLWDLFGEKWNEPEYYSLILQPFIISPSINVGDILVAVKLSPPGTSLEMAMRKYHPFPLFERYVDHDISIDGRNVLIKANTQVEMFLSDFKDSAKWPLFGAGERVCAGRHLAMPLLKVLHTELTPLSNFDPSKNHLYSGRSNDDSLTVSQALFFLNTIGSIILYRLYDKLTGKAIL